jgi:hypothetical protein
MDRLTAFGLFAVTAMLVCYALEARSRWFILAFAISCMLGSAYGFLQGAWPFGLVEAIWSLVDRHPVFSRAEPKPKPLPSGPGATPPASRAQPTRAPVSLTPRSAAS